MDERFSIVSKDPRFRLMGKRERKVKIDKRFSKMFSDRNFKLKYTVDKRGRPVNHTSNDHLQKYYELSSADERDSDEDEAKTSSSNKKQKAYEDSPKVKQVAADQPASEKPKQMAVTHAQGKTESLTTRSAVTTKAKPGKIHRDTVTSTAKSSVMGRNQAATAPKMLHGSADGSHRVDTDEDSSEHLQEIQRSQAEECATISEEDSDISDGSSISDEDCVASDAYAEPAVSDTKREKLLAVDGPDYARGEGALSSSDTESDDSFYDDAALTEDASAHDDHYWGEMDKEADSVEEATARLAVCNMDWDRIKAIDLMMLFNSFKPSGSIVKSVKIYPSDYGLERMKEEERCGPKELNAPGSALLSKDEANLSAKEREKKQREWLRLYQLNRLKYYYAVVECDSAATASNIYEQCDGLEYESSSTKIDLRFIPDDMTFDDRQITSETSDVSDVSTYKPSLFVNTALNQSKVDCTWDETNTDRLMVTSKKFTKDELEAMDLKVYLASSSGSEHDDPDSDDTQTKNRGSSGEKIKKHADAPCDVSGDSGGNEKDSADDEEADLNKYRSLLREIEQKESGVPNKDVEMEISWEPGLKEDTAAIVEKRAAAAEGMTVWDKYLEKRRDKRKEKIERKKLAQERTKDGESSDDAVEGTCKRRRMKAKATHQTDESGDKEKAELSLLVMDDGDGRKHFNMKKIVEEQNMSKKKKKKKKKLAEKVEKADTFEIDLGDPRFSAVYTSHLYNIDPSAQEFKKTKSSMAIIEEKLKRRAAVAGSDGDRLPRPPAKPVSSSAASSGIDSSLAMLVKSVKAKSKSYKHKAV